MHLGQCRAEIDRIDIELIGLLNTRVSLAIEIAERKRKRGTAIRDTKREREVLRRLTNMNEGPMDSRAVNEIFRQIIDESRRIAIDSGPRHPRVSRIM